ncbi:hypothetical protein [Sulfuracidifex tepidarius]|nr:hypothetical protein [Sulfuracidifex tepidarius]
MKGVQGFETRKRRETVPHWSGTLGSLDQRRDNDEGSKEKDTL